MFIRVRSWPLFLGVIAVVTPAVSPNAASGQLDHVSVMTFNVWGGESTQTGRDKIVEIIQTSGADIVGIQELDNAVLDDIAADLGFHFHQQSGGDIQVLSRYPIVGQSPSNLGVEIELVPDFNVWLFNAHLAAYPYQPYDLRDGILPPDAAAVIAAADAARGGSVTSYLNDMTTALASGSPVFFTGDFNEPSHLDWTQAAADATTRPFDLEVAYPTSSRIVAAGFVDSFRAVRPDEVNDPAYTWTPGSPPPNPRAPDEVHDRIDIVYHAGPGSATGAFTVGLDDTNVNTDLGIDGYNSDHRAVVAEFDVLPLAFIPGDVNLDGVFSGDGTGLAEEDDVTAFIEGWMTVLPTDDIETRWTKGDLNLNGMSEMGDLALLHDVLVAAGLSFSGFHRSVPEPAAIVMAAVGGIAAIASTRRKRRFRVLLSPRRANSVADQIRTDLDQFERA